MQLISGELLISLLDIQNWQKTRSITARFKERGLSKILMIIKSGDMRQNVKSKFLRQNVWFLLKESV